MCVCRVQVQHFKTQLQAAKHEIAVLKGQLASGAHHTSPPLERGANGRGGGGDGEQVYLRGWNQWRPAAWAA
jgi:hypothetical protein